MSCAEKDTGALPKSCQPKRLQQSSVPTAVFVIIPAVLIYLICLVFLTYIFKWRWCGLLEWSPNKKPTWMGFNNDPDEIRNEKLRRLAEVAPYDKTDSSSELSDDEVPDVCAICLAVLDNTEVTRKLPCAHIFHDKCLQDWYLGDHLTCPICRKQYIEKPETV